MDTCLLANTGVNVYYAAGIALAMLSVPLLIIFRATRHKFGILFLVLIFGFVAAPTPALAGPSCSPIAGNAVTSGVLGATQVYSIAGNDSPTPGATFVASSLRLTLRSASPSGSTVSVNRLLATLPGEGAYTASPANVTISFDPEGAFVGTGVGILYSIDDTAGNTLTNSYTPTVTSGVTTCADPTVADIALRSQSIWLDDSDGATGSTSLAGNDTSQFKSVASSADGTKLVAAALSDYIYTSADSGVTWTARTVAGFGDWQAVASSADGTHLAVASTYGYIYTSPDSGVSWTERTNSPFESWQGIASSADGTKLAAVTYYGYIYTSADSGVTWTEHASMGVQGWAGIASSADGTKLAATMYVNTSLYTSSDAGTTWTEQTLVGANNPQGIASSSDGTRLAVTDSGGYIYTSSDSGVTWTAQTTVGSRGWVGIASSGDGSKLAAVAFGENIQTSSDFGSTWTEQPAPGALSWAAIASSADATKLVAIAQGDYIYTSSDSGATWTVRHHIPVIDPYSIDIDASTPGLQTTIDKTLSEGWSATYDPAIDTYTVTVTNAAIFDPDTMASSYTLYLTNCSQPSEGAIQFHLFIGPG